MNVNLKVWTMSEKRWTHPPSKMEAVFHSLICHTRNAHLKGTAVLPLAEVDRLVRVVRRFDPKHPTLENASWGWRVEPDVPHLYHPITDITEKYAYADELPEPYLSDRWLVTPKFRGVAVVAHYKHGVLQRCLTQGDGRRGWDVTNNAVSRIPVVIRPHYGKNRKERFTGYIRCVATVNQDKFFIKHSSLWLLESIHNILTTETPAPRASSPLRFIPVNVYNAPYDQFVRVGSPGWDACTRDFPDKLKFKFVTSNNAECLTDDFIAPLSYPHPYDGAVVRRYGDENKLQGVFTRQLRGEPTPVLTEVRDIVWKTFDNAKIRPTILCDKAEVGGKWPLGVSVTEFPVFSYQSVLVNKILPGNRIALKRRPDRNIAVSFVEVKQDAPQYDLNVKCSYGCDPEFLEFDRTHAYCRNPKCPATTRAMFKNALDIFAPKHFYAPTRERVMKHFHYNVFEFWGYYKTTGDISIAAIAIDGLCRVGKAKYCELLFAMSRWELDFRQLVQLCGIEYMGDASVKLIAGKAASNAELTQWAECTASLPPDWGIANKAFESWAQRHYLVKEVLRYFKIIRRKTVLIV